MIVAVACVPQAPLLVPGLTGGAVVEVQELRAAVRDAVGVTTAHDPDEVIVVGAAPATVRYPPDAPSPAGRLAPAPGRRPRGTTLPVPLAVGRSALAGRSVPWILQGVQDGAPVGRCSELGRRIAARPGRTALLVAADGSARRGEKAPGYLDPRAEDVDARVADALGSADPAALLALDSGLCADLLVAGRAAWQVMAGACDGMSWLARVLYSGDPFGVFYQVVTWIPSGAGNRPAGSTGSRCDAPARRGVEADPHPGRGACGPVRRPNEVSPDEAPADDH